MPSPPLLSTSPAGRPQSPWEELPRLVECRGNSEGPA
jgi:hypothetical protein